MTMKPSLNTIFIDFWVIIDMSSQLAAMVFHWYLGWETIFSASRAKSIGVELIGATSSPTSQWMQHIVMSCCICQKQLLIDHVTWECGWIRGFHLNDSISFLCPKTPLKFIKISSRSKNDQCWSMPDHPGEDVVGWWASWIPFVSQNRSKQQFCTGRHLKTWINNSRNFVIYGLRNGFVYNSRTGLFWRTQKESFAPSQRYLYIAAMMDVDAGNELIAKFKDWIPGTKRSVSRGTVELSRRGIRPSSTQIPTLKSSWIQLVVAMATRPAATIGRLQSTSGMSAMIFHWYFQIIRLWIMYYIRISKHA